MLVATVLHDPDLKLLEPLSKKVTSPPYSDDFVVILSDDTPCNPYMLLLGGDKVVVQTKPGIGNARREALVYFLNTQHERVLLADFDRLLFWLDHDPNSFYRLLWEHKSGDYITIGRTEKALDSHPQPQRATERAISVYTAILYPNYPVRDIVAGTYIMSSTMAHYIASHSYAVDPGAVDVEWYILAHLQQPDADVPYVLVDGLGYEGQYLGLEPVITNDIRLKRQLNLQRAIGYVDATRFWSAL